MAARYTGTGTGHWDRDGTLGPGRDIGTGTGTLGPGRDNFLRYSFPRRPEREWILYSACGTSFLELTFF